MNTLEFSPIKKSLFTIIKLAKADIQKRFIKHNIGLTAFQFGVLALTKDAPITINQIAIQCDCKAPSIVPVVDVLEKAKFLDRATDSTDRRKTQLVITKKGLAILQKIPLNDQKDALHIAFSKLNQTNQKILIQLLAELITNFKE